MSRDVVRYWSVRGLACGYKKSGFAYVALKDESFLALLSESIILACKGCNRTVTCGIQATAQWDRRSSEPVGRLRAMYEQTQPKVMLRSLDEAS